MDILTLITTQRVLDVASAKASTPVDFLRARISSRYPHAPLNLLEVVAGVRGMAVAAEFKRASPSKGDIVAPDAAIEPFACAYTAGGAHIMSVLTEPSWFKGSLGDMEAARQASAALAQEAGRAQRPAILRKDFVLDEYQLLEARAFGADTVLLIVASLPSVAVLAPLVAASRALGMEPLVEVNTVEELDVALSAGAAVVGINNRNLRTFEVDLGTTARIVAHAAATRRGAAAAAAAPGPLAILSLSGIKSGRDVTELAAECALAPGGLEVMRGFLIGEALMRCPSPQALVSELCAAGVGARGELPWEESSPQPQPHRLAPALAAKICGVRDAGAALHAARCGAHFIGLILVPGSPRCIDSDTARGIVGALRAFREQDPQALLAPCCSAGSASQGAPAAPPRLNAPRLRACWRALEAASQRARPLCVGVFRNATPQAVLLQAKEVGLDLVQLHGEEAAVDFEGFPLPIVKVLHVRSGGGGGGGGGGRAESQALALSAAGWSSVAAVLLLDSAAGGGAPGGGFPTPRCCVPSMAPWGSAACQREEAEVVVVRGGLCPCGLRGGCSPQPSLKPCGGCGVRSPVAQAVPGPLCARWMCPAVQRWRGGQRASRTPSRCRLL